MKALVTGAAGFIGSTLCDRLLAAGHEVVGVDSFLDFYPRPLKEANLEGARRARGFRFVEGDLLQLPLGRLLRGVEVVFHQAAQAGVRTSWGEGFAVYTRNNIDATQKLLEAAKGEKGLRRFVYASSSSVYGEARSFPMKEDHPTHPVSPYGVTKLAAEHLCRLYHGAYGVPTVSLRYFTVFGPRQRPDMAFRKFLTAALEGRPIEVYGDGRQSRDFTYVADAVEANLLALRPAATGEVFNIGGGNRATVREVLRIVARIVGRPLRVRYGDRARGDVRRTVAGAAKARRVLGFRPKVGLAEGLRREYDWLVQRRREA